jgi:hypothetical protein
MNTPLITREHSSLSTTATLFSFSCQAAPSGVLICRDSSLTRQHQDVVEAPQRIHDSRVSLLYEREHQTDGKRMIFYYNHRVLH